MEQNANEKYPKPGWDEIWIFWYSMWWRWINVQIMTNFLQHPIMSERTSLLMLLAVALVDATEDVSTGIKIGSTIILFA